MSVLRWGRANKKHKMINGDSRIQATNGRNGIDTHVVNNVSAVTTIKRILPLFHYEPPKNSRRMNGVVLIGHEVFHTIVEMNVFYVALDYDNVARDSGLSEDEFVWDRYTRDNAKMSQHCLQFQLAIYLHNHSYKFNEMYGQAYEAMIGNCKLKVIDVNDHHLCQLSNASDHRQSKNEVN